MRAMKLPVDEIIGMWDGILRQSEARAGSLALFTLAQ